MGAITEHYDTTDIPNSVEIPAGTELVMNGLDFPWEEDTFTFWGIMTIEEAYNGENDFGTGQIRGRLKGYGICFDIDLGYSTADGVTEITATTTEEDGTQKTYKGYFVPGPDGSEWLKGTFEEFLEEYNTVNTLSGNEALTEDNAAVTLCKILLEMYHDEAKNQQLENGETIELRNISVYFPEKEEEQKKETFTFWGTAGYSDYADSESAVFSCSGRFAAYGCCFDIEATISKATGLIVTLTDYCLRT